MASAKATAAPPPTKKSFGKLPNSVVRDRRISPEYLVLLAYRSTFIGEYALHEKHICAKPSKGKLGIASNMTRDVYRRALAETVEPLHPVQTRPQSLVLATLSGSSRGRGCRMESITLAG